MFIADAEHPRIFNQPPALRREISSPPFPQYDRAHVTINPSPLFPHGRRFDVSVQHGIASQVNDGAVSAPSLWGLLPLGTAGLVGAYGIEEVVRSNFIKDEKKARFAKIRGYSAISAAPILACAGSAPASTEIPVSTQTPITAPRATEASAATATVAPTETLTPIDFDTKAAKNSLWQLYPADVVGKDFPLMLKKTSLYLNTKGELQLLHPYTDSSQPDMSHSYAFGRVELYSPTPPKSGESSVYEGTVLFENKNGVTTAGFLKQIATSENTWEFQRLNLKTDGNTQSIAVDKDTLVVRQNEDGYSFSLKNAKGNETMLGWQTETSESPTAVPSVMPSDGNIYDVAFKIDAKRALFKAPKEKGITRIENGVEYTLITLTDANGKEIVSDYFFPVTYQFPMLTGKGQDTCLTTVWLQQEKDQTFFPKITKSTGSNFTEFDNSVYGLFEQIYAKRENVSLPLSQDEFARFNQALNNGEITRSVKIDNSFQDWKINAGANIYILNYDTARSLEGVRPWYNMPQRHNFLTKILKINDDGGLDVAVASQKPLKDLSDDEIRMLIVSPQVNAWEYDKSTGAGFGAMLQVLINGELKVSPGRMEITP